MEISNGGLYFEADFDNSKLKAGVDETIRRIQGLSDASVKGGENMDEAFNKVASDINSAFEKIDMIVGEHKNSIKALEEEYRKIGLAAGTSLEVGSGGYLTERQQSIYAEIKMRRELIKESESAADSLQKEEIAFEKLRKKVTDNANAHQTLRTRIRDLENEMAVLVSNGIDQQSEAYRSLSAELGRLRDIQGDISTQGKILANDEARFQGVIAGLSGLAGGFSAATGAMSLFAGENENLQAVMTKVQSVMAITIGMQQVSQALNKDSAFKLVTLARAKDMVAASSLRLGKAFMRMGMSASSAKLAIGALYATATLGISLAITGAIRLWNKYSEAQKRAAEETKKAIEIQKDARTKAFEARIEIGLVKKELESFVGTRDQERKKVEELNRKYGESFGYYKTLTEWYDALLGKGEDYIQMLFLQAKAQALVKKAAEADNRIPDVESAPDKEYSKWYDPAVDAYRQGMWNLTKDEKYNPYKNSASASAKNRKKKEIDAIKKERDDYLNSLEEISDKISNLRKKNLKEFKEDSKVESGKEPFASMLEDRKKKYNEYFKWLDSGYEKEAQIHFAGLLKEGKTYKDFLQGLIDSGNLTKKQLYQVTNELADDTDTSLTDIFKKSLEEQMKNAGSVVEQLKLVQQIRDNLTLSEDSLKEKKEAILKEAENQLRESRKEEIQEVLKNNVSLYDAKIELHQKYLADIDILESERGKSFLASDQQRIDRSIAYRKKKYDEDKANLLKATAEAKIGMIELMRDAKTLDISKKTYAWEADRKKALLDVEKKAAEEILSVYKKLQEEAPSDEIAQIIARITLEIEQMNAELDKMPKDKFQEVLSGLQKISSALGGLDGEIGEIFSSLSGEIDTIKVAFSDTANATDMVSAGISSIVNVINMVTAASAKRDRIEKEFYKNKIALAHEYALALNDTLRTQSEMSESGFVKDYSGRINDGFKALSESTEKYNEAIAKLSEGRAKTSLKSVVNWGNVGKGALSGAAAGAAIGSVVPLVGTAIGAAAGAIIGGLAGLFGGKKKKNEYGALTEVFPELVDGAGKLNKELAKSIINTDQVNDKTKQLIQNALDWAEATEKANQQIKEVVVDLAGDLGNGIKNALVESFRAGEDASKRMFDAAGKSLEQFVENLVFSALFSDAFKTFEKEVTESLGLNGDKDVVDDYDRLMSVLKGRENIFNESLRAIKGRANSQGFDLWGKGDDKGTGSSLTGAIKGVTEETASMIGGQMNAIRINQLEATQALRKQLFHLANIDRNTGSIDKNTKYIKSIYDKMNTGDSLRSKGLQ